MTTLQPIGVVAEDLGVTTRTLRYYEQLGLLQPTLRMGRGPRCYDAEARARVAMIRRMQAAGLSLQTIRLVLDLRAEVARLDDQQAFDDQPPSLERVEYIAAAVRARHAEVCVRVRQMEDDLAHARNVEEQLARDAEICETTLAERRTAEDSRTTGEV